MEPFSPLSMLRLYRILCFTDETSRMCVVRVEGCSESPPWEIPPCLTATHLVSLEDLETLCLGRNPGICFEFYFACHFRDGATQNTPVVTPKDVSAAWQGGARAQALQCSCTECFRACALIEIQGAASPSSFIVLAKGSSTWIRQPKSTCVFIWQFESG